MCPSSASSNKDEKVASQSHVLNFPGDQFLPTVVSVTQPLPSPKKKGGLKKQPVRPRDNRDKSSLMQTNLSLNEERTGRIPSGSQESNGGTQIGTN